MSPHLGALAGLSSAGRHVWLIPWCQQPAQGLLCGRSLVPAWLPSETVAPEGPRETGNQQAVALYFVLKRKALS